MWFIPIKAKSDMFVKFHEFRIKVEIFFDSTILCLQTDNGGEFINNRFKHYVTPNGMTHWKSFPYTSAIKKTSR